MSEMSYTRMRVRDVSYGVMQQGDVGQTPFVLLHGFTGSAASWVRHVETFAASGLRVLTLDMLGHGQSDAPDDPARYSIERTREDILVLLQMLRVRAGEAILLGYSMGGRIALYTALSGFFRALILESASPGLDSEKEREARRHSDEVLATRIEREGVPTFIDYWEHIPLFASQQQLPLETREALHRQRLHNSARGLANSLRGVGTGVQPQLSASLPDLTLPVLLLAGELDQKFTAIAHTMATQLPHAQVAIVPDAGHTIHLEQPERFDALVLDFYNRITRQFRNVVRV